jgi:predicted DCC family thiol-disulfide oxidoreductase YuxK
MATCSIPEVKKEPERPRWSDRLESWYGLDTRSLALFRVALALMILGDLYMRAWDLRAFYTDWGTLPRGFLIADFAHPWLLSLHYMSGQSQFQALLFIVAAVFALMMLFGWRTRLATVMSWILLTSLHNRNPVILQGGDTLFRMILFWAMFLPLGLVRSVDSALSADEPQQPPRRIFTIASVALMAQIAMMYWSAVLYKTGPEWHREGTAVWYALSLEQMATPLGQYMLHFPGVLNFLTYFTLVVEATAPLFFIIPIVVGPLRTVGVLFLFALHLGFGSFMYLGHFPFVAAVMLTAMLPSYFWEQIARDAKNVHHLKIYYDGDCGFCRKSVLIIRSLLLHPTDEVLIAQNDERAIALMRERNSWVVENDRGERFTETRAMAEIFRHSPVLWPFAAVLVAKPVKKLGDRFYHLIERNRSTMSRWTSRLQYRPLRWKLTAPVEIAVAFFLLLTIWWNMQNQKPAWKMPQRLDSIALAFRLDQYWDMFSPGPLREDGWYVIEGTLKNGKRVDIWRNGAPVSFNRIPPTQVAAQYPNERWRKYMMNLYADKYSGFRLWFDRYMCRKWNEGKAMDDPRLLEIFNVYYMVHMTQPPGVAEEPHRRVLVAQHYCWR